MGRILQARDFVLSLLLFFFSLCFTFFISYYFKSVVNAWLSSHAEYLASGITSLVSSEINNYKLNYYGVAELSKSLYAVSPETLKSSTKISDALGRSEYVAIISQSPSNPYAVLLSSRGDKAVFEKAYMQDVASAKFKAAISSAMSTTSPFFYTSTDIYENDFIIGVVPVDSSTSTFFYVVLSYDDLLIHVLKADTFGEHAMLALQIFDGEKSVYKSPNFVEMKDDNNRRRKDMLIKQSVPLSTGSLTFVYTEGSNTNISNILRKIPFTITLVGTLMSLLAFCLVLGVTFGVKYKSYVTSKI